MRQIRNRPEDQLAAHLKAGCWRAYFRHANLAACWPLIGVQADGGLTWVGPIGFQILNSIRKLLKKHSKQTSLPNVIQVSNLSSRVAGHDQHVIKVLSERLVEVVPILENYECPICREIAYKPVKMNFGHRFCKRCALEVETKVYMEHWFPKEIKLRTKDDAKELAIEELNELGLPVLKSGCVIN
ncbi:hypothetical protein DFH28DRAFT_931066 [Melampsora americana]|nr:hypothetical protein DFH28DRAFT_931066 [Melampsora americana]